VEAQKALVILSTGKCSGQVTCQDLVVEAGGVLNATVVCKKASA
jgi:cytoskeletal protein CcmA (bactofilin family)